jgi:hypothetical protein
MNEGEADFLKPLDQVLIPDSRTLYNFPSADDAFKAHYELVSKIILNAHVHNDAKVQFETAKNAFVYSFFAYRLGMMSVHQAIAATELALRRMIGDPNKKPKETFQPLLQKAHDMGLVDVKKIAPHMDIAGFKKFLGGFRNDLSHGSHTLMPPFAMAPIIRDCGNILNQLFENAHTQNLKPSWNAWS